MRGYRLAYLHFPRARCKSQGHVHAHIDHKRPQIGPDRIPAPTNGSATYGAIEVLRD